METFPSDFGAWNRPDKIRSMKTLIEQIRMDHKDLKQLWERYARGQIDESGTDRLLQALSWIRLALRGFQEIQGGSVEGISWGEMKAIEKDVLIKEMIMKETSQSVSKETEFTHLR